MSLKINVVGAGINGLASAYCLAKRFPDSEIIITASEFEPNTTSNHGFGIILNTAKNCSMLSSEANNFVKQTIAYCSQMDPAVAHETGIKTVDVMYFGNLIDESSKMLYDNVKMGMHGVRDATKDEMFKMGVTVQNKKLQKPFKGKAKTNETLKGIVGVSYVIDTCRYLRWLTKRLEGLQTRGGSQQVRFVKQKLSSLNELPPCDFIVNCSGFGARALVKDSLVIPVRGQYVSIYAPHIKKCVYAGGACVIPLFDGEVRLGSIKQIGECHTEVDPNDTEELWQRSEVFFPDLRKAKLNRVGVGIRPGRIGGTRLELQKMNKDGLFLKTPIIHNYGHGSGGISQHWGCSLKVADLAAQLVFSSKL